MTLRSHPSYGFLVRDPPGSFTSVFVLFFPPILPFTFATVSRRHEFAPDSRPSGYAPVAWMGAALSWDTKWVLGCPGGLCLRGG